MQAIWLIKKHGNKTAQNEWIFLQVYPIPFGNETVKSKKEKKIKKSILIQSRFVTVTQSLPLLFRFIIEFNEIMEFIIAAIFFWVLINLCIPYLVVNDELVKWWRRNFNSAVENAC